MYIMGTDSVWPDSAYEGEAELYVPVGCNAVYISWSYWYNYAGLGLESITLAGQPPDQSFELPSTATENATGVCVWYDPPAGSQTLIVTWDVYSGIAGPNVIATYVRGCDTSGWRDASADHGDFTDPVVTSVDSNSNDLVIKHDTRYDSLPNQFPSTSNGWTSYRTQSRVGLNTRLSILESPGAESTTCNSENEYVSSVVAWTVIAEGGITTTSTSSTTTSSTSSTTVTQSSTTTSTFSTTSTTSSSSTTVTQSSTTSSSSSSSSSSTTTSTFSSTTTTTIPLQYIYPASDITSGSWNPSSGEDLYAMLDEDPANDSDYIHSSSHPSNDTCEVKFEVAADPLTDQHHVVKYRYKKSGVDTINLTFYLMQGVTQIATWSHNDISTTVTQGSYTLTSEEADSITDYHDLRLRITANEV